jgi:hypothetical protein
MPLPLLACLDAAGDSARLHDAIVKAQLGDEYDGVLLDHFTLKAILLAQKLMRRLSNGDQRYWREWLQRNAAGAIDFAADHSDPIPGIVHRLSEIYLGLRSIPRFMRSTRRIPPMASLLGQGS